MFNIGTGEILVIALIALIVLGPDKLPQAARQVGQFTAEARKIANGFRQEMKSAMDEVADTASPSDDRRSDRQLAAPPADAQPIDVESVEAQPLETQPLEPGPAPPSHTNGSNGVAPSGAEPNGAGSAAPDSSSDQPSTATTDGQSRS